MNTVCFTVGIFAILITLISISLITSTNGGVYKRAIEKDKMQYNSTTGELHYLDPVLKYILTGEE